MLYFVEFGRVSAYFAIFQHVLSVYMDPLFTFGSLAVKLDLHFPILYPSKISCIMCWYRNELCASYRTDFHDV